MLDGVPEGLAPVRGAVVDAVEEHRLVIGQTSALIVLQPHLLARGEGDFAQGQWWNDYAPRRHPDLELVVELGEAFRLKEERCGLVVDVLFVGSRVVLLGLLLKDHIVVLIVHILSERNVPFIAAKLRSVLIRVHAIERLHSLLLAVRLVGLRVVVGNLVGGRPLRVQECGRVQNPVLVLVGRGVEQGERLRRLLMLLLLLAR